VTAATASHTLSQCQLDCSSLDQYAKGTHGPHFVTQRKLLQQSIYCKMISMMFKVKEEWGILLSVLLNPSGEQCILAFRPLSFLQTSRHCIMPSLTTVFVCSSRKFCSDSAPINLSQMRSERRASGLQRGRSRVLPVFNIAASNHCR
jgi:hypothetical protein